MRSVLNRGLVKAYILTNSIPTILQDVNFPLDSKILVEPLA